MKVLSSAVVMVGAVLAQPVVAQSLPETDNSGKGAILCMYDIYSSVQAVTKACEWERNATDAVIDQGVRDLEAFIVANSGDGSAVRVMQSIQQRNAEEPLDPLTGQCTGFDPEDRGSSMAFIWMVRTSDADQLTQGFADMLSVPREPLYNPCL